MDKEKDWDYIARLEKAIAKKYGIEAVQNPSANWSEEKEKEYLQQLKKLSTAQLKKDEQTEKIEMDGFLVSKKLVNKDTNRKCPVCEKYSFRVKDDIYMNKFECCYKCYIQYIDGREKRWLKGWRPNKEKD